MTYVRKIAAGHSIAGIIEIPEKWKNKNVEILVFPKACMVLLTLTQIRKKSSWKMQLGTKPSRLNADVADAAIQAKEIIEKQPCFVPTEVLAEESWYFAVTLLFSVRISNHLPPRQFQSNNFNRK
jgi:hypothetical protein